MNTANDELKAALQQHYALYEECESQGIRVGREATRRTPIETIRHMNDRLLQVLEERCRSREEDLAAVARNGIFNIARALSEREDMKVGGIHVTLAEHLENEKRVRGSDVFDRAAKRVIGPHSFSSINPQQQALIDVGLTLFKVFVEHAQKSSAATDETTIVPPDNVVKPSEN